MTDLPLLLNPQRQTERLAALPAAYKAQYERLALELALKLDDSAVIFQRHGYTPEQALALLETKGFAALLEHTAQEVREKGLSFRAKARVMAEDLLQHGYEIATDDHASAAVRADLIQWMARVADLEPPKKDGKDTGAGGGLHLSITFAGQAPQTVTTGREPITIEAE